MFSWPGWGLLSESLETHGIPRYTIVGQLKMTEKAIFSKSFITRCVPRIRHCVQQELISTYRLVPHAVNQLVLAISSLITHNHRRIRVRFWFEWCLVSDAGSQASGSSGRDLSDEVSPGGFSLSQLGEMLEAERSYLLAIATQEFGLHLMAKGGESDLVQDTFLNATRDLPHFSGRTPDEFRSWLRSILKHNLMNFRRRYLDTAKREAGREVPLGSTLEAVYPDGKIPTPSRVAMQVELMASLRAAIRTLSPAYQQIIELRSIQQLPFEDIARQLNSSSEASRKLWCRAVEALQSELLTQNHDISGLP